MLPKDASSNDDDKEIADLIKRVLIVKEDSIHIVSDPEVREKLIKKLEEIETEEDKAFYADVLNVNASLRDPGSIYAMWVKQQELNVLSFREEREVMEPPKDTLKFVGTPSIPSITTRLQQKNQKHCAKKEQAKLGVTIKASSL